MNIPIDCITNTFNIFDITKLFVATITPKKVISNILL